MFLNKESNSLKNIGSSKMMQGNKLEYKSSDDFIKRLLSWKTLRFVLLKIYLPMLLFMLIAIIIPLIVITSINPEVNSILPGWDWVWDKVWDEVFPGADPDVAGMVTKVLIAIIAMMEFLILLPMTALINASTVLITNYLSGSILLEDFLFSADGFYGLPREFWMIAIIMMVILLFFIMYKIINFTLLKVAQDKKIVMNNITSSLSSIIIAIFMPFIFWFINYISSELIILFYKGSLIQETELADIINNAFDDATKPWTSEGGWERHVFKIFNSIVLIIIGYWMVVISMFMIMKTMKLVIFFMLLFVAACWSVLDNGAKFKYWLSTVVATFLGIVAMHIGFIFGMSNLGVVLKITDLVDEKIVKLIFTCLLVVGIVASIAQIGIILENIMSKSNVQETLLGVAAMTSSSKTSNYIQGAKLKITSNNSSMKNIYKNNINVTKEIKYGSTKDRRSLHLNKKQTSHGFKEMKNIN